MEVSPLRRLGDTIRKRREALGLNQTDLVLQLPIHGEFLSASCSVTARSAGLATLSSH